MSERIHEVIHSGHIEAPEQSFFVRYHHRAYRPQGFPFAFASGDRLAEVLAQTPEGALKIARYHHFMFGSDFTLETRTPERPDNRSREVAFH